MISSVIKKLSQLKIGKEWLWSISIVLLLIWLVELPVLPEKQRNLFFSLFGLYCAIRFRHNGRSAIEQRRKLDKRFNPRHREQDFDAGAVLFTQIMYLIVGIIFFFVGLLKFLS